MLGCLTPVLVVMLCGNGRFGQHGLARLSIIASDGDLCRTDRLCGDPQQTSAAGLEKPAVTKAPVTKVVVTKPTPVLKVVRGSKKGGRPRLGKEVLTGAERTRGWRSRGSGGGTS